MSLINRMLKDLSSRERDAGNVMSGIQIPSPARSPRPLLPRLGALLVLVTVFTAGLWWVFGPRYAPIPTPRAAPSVPQGFPAATRAGDKNSSSMTPAALPARSAEVAAAPVPASDTEQTQARTTAEPADSAATLAPSESTPSVAAASATDMAAPPLAETYYAQGRRAQDSGDLAAAERNYVLALKANPRTHPAREALIALRLEQGRLAEAGRSLELGLLYAPHRPAFLQLAERLERAGGRPPSGSASAAASSPATAAAQPAPSPPVAAAAPAATPKASADELAAREAQALRLIEQGRLTEAAEIVSQGREQAAAWSGYRRLAARIEIARDRPDAALALLQFDPPPLAADPEYHGLLASVYQRLGRQEEAARTYQGLIRAQPGEAHWWAGYGISKDVLGESQEALRAYSQARQLGRLDPRVLEYISQRVTALKAGG